MSKTKLTGIELSNYLESKNVGTVYELDEIKYVPPYLLNNPTTTLDEILPCVKALYTNVNKLNAKTIHLSIGLGFYLQILYNLWKILNKQKKLHKAGNNG